MGDELVSNHKWKANMKADNTKKREYTEPQIEYIPFVYADAATGSGGIEDEEESYDDEVSSNNWIP